MLDPIITDLVSAIHQHVGGAKTDDQALAEAGALLNYSFNMLALGILLNIPAETRYAHLERLMGTFEAAKLEFWRRVVVPYENYKMAEHGDVFRA